MKGYGGGHGDPLNHKGGYLSRQTALTRCNAILAGSTPARNPGRGGVDGDTQPYCELARIK